MYVPSHTLRNLDKLSIENLTGHTVRITAEAIREAQRRVDESGKYMSYIRDSMLAEELNEMIACAKQYEGKLCCECGREFPIDGSSMCRSCDFHASETRARRNRPSFVPERD